MRRVVLSLVGALALITLPAMAQTGTNGTGNQMDTTNGGTTTTTNGTYNGTDTNNGTTTTTGGTYDNGTTTTGTTTTVTGTETTPGTSTTGFTDGNTRIVNGQQVPEPRTNPAVPTHSPNSGMTATGTIASWNHNELVLRTSTGLTHFKMLPETTGYTTNFQEGQVASVDFSRNEQGVLIAKQVRLGTSTTATTTTMTTTPVETAPAAPTTDTTNNDTTTNNNTASTYPSTTDTTTSTYPTTPSTTDTTASTTTDTTTDTTSATRMPATASESPLVALLGLLALAGAAGLRRL